MNSLKFAPPALDSGVVRPTSSGSQTPAMVHKLRAEGCGRSQRFFCKFGFAMPLFWTSFETPLNASKDILDHHVHSKCSTWSGPLQLHEESHNPVPGREKIQWAYFEINRHSTSTSFLHEITSQPQDIWEQMWQTWKFGCSSEDICAIQRECLWIPWLIDFFLIFWAATLAAKQNEQKRLVTSSLWSVDHLTSWLFGIEACSLRDRPKKFGRPRVELGLLCSTVCQIACSFCCQSSLQQKIWGKHSRLRATT